MSALPAPKRLDIPLAGPMGDEDAKAIARLNERFPREDIRVEPNGGSVSVFVRQVDIKVLEESAAEAGPAGSTVIAQVLEAVRAVRSYGVRSGKRCLVGYADERKVKGRAQKEKQRGKHYYAAGDTFTRERNDLPEAFADRIVCGDSEQVLKGLPDNCVDLVFTSPPYNFGLSYGDSPDESHWPEYFRKLFRVFDECIRVLRHGGRIVVNIQPLYSDYIPSHHVIGNFFIGRRMIWKGEILWEKNNYNCKYTAWGSWKSPSNPYLKYTWEFIEVYCKGDLKKEGDSRDADITADEFKGWVYGKWSIAPERRMGEFGHPAMFPEALADRVLRLFSFRGDAILDPFAGAGTTCVAAKRSSRRYLGIDISEEYCRVARDRLGAELL